MPGKEGPFRCDNCKYYPSANTCNNKRIIELAKEGKFGLSMKGEMARVEPDGCSDEYEKR